MTEISAKEVFNRRLPLYTYLEPLLAGRRVLELGTGTGAGAAHLATHGAVAVVSVDTDEGVVERARARHVAPNLTFRAATSLLDVAPGAPFDVVVVPEAEALLRRPETIPSLARLLVPGGRLVLVASSADRGVGSPGGVGYYELSDALLPHFPAVQMFGVTPFAAFGVVEFDVDGDGLRVDSRLVEGGVEPPGAYVAVAGAERAGDLGYALVQMPFAPIEAKLAAGGRRAKIEKARDDRRRRGSRRRGPPRRRRAAARRGRAAQPRAPRRGRHAHDGAAPQARGRGGPVRVGDAHRARAGRGDRRAARPAAARGRGSRRARRRARQAAPRARRGRRIGDEPDPPHGRGDVGRRGAPRREPARAAAPPPRARTCSACASTSAEAEARASAAEQRLEEVATVGRERQAALDDLLERLRQAEEATARERREVERLRAQVRDAGGQARTLDERESTIVRRDERIAKLEGEKQELVWRLAELEEKLRQTIGRAVISDNTGRNQADELDAARSARARAVEQFHKVAGAHVDEATALRASVAEQAALVAELEEAVRVAEAAATAATAEAATLRKNSKGLEEAERTRRTRLAELEGKLLRLEYEKKQAAAGVPAGANFDVEAFERRTAELARARDDAARERDAAAAERDEARDNLARLMGAAAQSTEALARATDELTASRARAGALEAELGRVRGAQASTGGNGHDANAVATARELAAVEAGLRTELESLAKIERALADELAEAQAPSARASLDEERGAEAILLHTTLANYRRHASRLRDELEGVRRRLDSLSPSEISGYLEELGEDLAEMEE